MFETLFPRSDNFLTRFQIKEKQEYEKKKKQYKTLIWKTAV